MATGTSLLAEVKNRTSFEAAQIIKKYFETNALNSEARIEYVLGVINQNKSQISPRVPIAIFGFATSSGLSEEEAKILGQKLYKDNQPRLSIFLSSLDVQPNVNKEHYDDLLPSSSPRALRTSSQLETSHSQNLS